MADAGLYGRLSISRVGPSSRVSTNEPLGAVASALAGESEPLSFSFLLLMIERQGGRQHEQDGCQCDLLKALCALAAACPLAGRYSPT